MRNQLPGPDGHSPRPLPSAPKFIEEGSGYAVRDAKFIDRKNLAADGVTLVVHVKRLRCLNDTGRFDGCAIVCEVCGPKLVGRPYLVPNLAGRPYVTPFQG